MRWPDRPCSQGCHDLIATGSIVAICLSELTSPSRSVQGHVTFSVNPVATLTRVSQIMTLHTPMGQDPSDERPGVS
ncbi:hypothetical protein Taro_026042 [Colocasia esculenta]|uniref:Uncharacterized protein n=1 Tax=Colocasia esculenta TaxID=4460 RepID=A0A843VAX3_COLES|nr:hypothetical protein [Colocasia esculenta]